MKASSAAAHGDLEAAAEAEKMAAAIAEAVEVAAATTQGNLAGVA